MSIYKDGKGYRYEFQIQKIRYTRSGFKTKKEARAAREKHLQELKTTPPTGGMDFRAATYEYLDHCKRRNSEKTFKEKIFVYRCFAETIGNLPLFQITPRSLEKYLLTRSTNSNYNKHRKNLSAFFTWAWRRGLVSVSPCIHVNSMPTEPGRKEIPSQEEVVKMFLAARDLRPFLLALFSLAARVGEINRLRWDDVNFGNRTATLWTRKGDGTYRAQPKPINDELYAELRRLYDKRAGEWVFPNPETGKPYVDRRKQLKRICRDAGVPCLGFHAIRHHVASLLADIHKVSLPSIQKMLGHSRATTTERYVQSLGDGVREAADCLRIFTMGEEPHTEPHSETKRGPAD